MTQDSYSLNTGSTAEHAPDYYETKKLGGVECHAGLMANSDHEKKELPQQDRLSVMALPGITSRNFASLLPAAFASMKDTFRQKLSRGKGVCASVVMFSPASGKLAIGSKGDVGAYLVLTSKKNPGEVLARRISSPNESYEISGDRSPHPINIHSDVPVMYARPDDYATEMPQSYEKPGFLAGGVGNLLGPQVPLLDIGELAQGIVKAAHKHAGAGAWKDYKLSLIVASDGFIYGKETPNLIVKDAVAHIPPGATNKAQAMMQYVSAERAIKSTDNMAVVVLDNIEPGVEGHPVAICVADEHSRSSKAGSAAGAFSAQAMIDVFEEKMAAAVIKNTPSFEGKFGARQGGKRAR